jgi:putative membrane protein
MKTVALTGLLLAGLAVSPAAPAYAARTAAAPTPPAAESIPDTAFLRAVHQANLAEIGAGGIARLTAVARAADVLLPDTPSAAQLALTKRYRSVPAAAFDRLYLRTQLAAHNEALAAAKAELANGQDPRVKELIAFAAPLVQGHHDALTAAYGTHSR